MYVWVRHVLQRFFFEHRQENLVVFSQGLLVLRIGDLEMYHEVSTVFFLVIRQTFVADVSWFARIDILIAGYDQFFPVNVKCFMESTKQFIYADLQVYVNIIRLVIHTKLLIYRMMKDDDDIIVRVVINVKRTFSVHFMDKVVRNSWWDL